MQSVAADEALATKNNCMACHKVDVKVVGPAYKEIAAKYKGDAAARDLLIEKVKKGGSGTWGPIPMPPNVAASDEDIATLVDWVLSM
ncbi:MAG TPA: c-type cytochrome [Gammaproteobacteria bacterium]|nr:c-type cytochrome [Gammaproteobacteria bacterium]